MSLSKLRSASEKLKKKKTVRPDSNVQDVERVYTVNLGKVLLSPDNQRAKRAVNMIKEFARHHMKIQQVKLEEDVSHLLWSRGIKHPPRKIRVRMTKTDEGYVLVSKYEAEEGLVESESTSEPEPVAKPTSEPEPVAKPTSEPDAKSDKVSEKSKSKSKD